MAVYSFVAWIFPMFLCGACASQITFTASRTAITPLLTPDLDMTCTLHDTSPAGSNLIGRDVTQTSDNLQFVMSMVITRREGDHVASVTQMTSAAAMLDQGSLNVTGRIAAPSSPGPRAHLQLEWTAPSLPQGGPYVCEVNAMDAQGHNVFFTQTLNIAVHEPSMGDVVQHLHDLTARVKVTEMENSELHKTVGALEQKVKDQEQALELFQNKTSHIEHGEVWCGNSRNWTDEGRHTDVRRTFTSPYPNPPIVYLGTRYFYSNDGNSLDYFAFTLEGVDNTGFTVRCWKIVNAPEVKDMAVPWISFSK